MRSDLSLSEIRILRLLLYVNEKKYDKKEKDPDKKKPQYPSQFAKRINIAPSNPYFVNVLKCLKDEGGIKELGIIGSTSIIEIDNVIIEDIIENQDITLFFKEYFQERGIVLGI